MGSRALQGWAGLRSNLQRTKGRGLVWIRQNRGIDCLAEWPASGEHSWCTLTCN